MIADTTLEARTVVLTALKRLTSTSKTKGGFGAFEVAVRTGLEHWATVDCLYALMGEGQVKRAPKGGWLLVMPGGRLGRVLTVITNGNGFLSFRRYAELACVTPTEFKTMVGELIKRGLIRPTADGWYEVL